MLLAMLVACGKTNENEGSGQGTVSTESTAESDQYGQQTYEDPTAGLNYNGKAVNFLVRSGSQIGRAHV